MVNALLGQTSGGGERIRKETEMRKLIANEGMTLDGVVQAPAHMPTRTRAEASSTAAGIRATSTTSPWAGRWRVMQSGG
jgi:hypothetical protein